MVLVYSVCTSCHTILKPGCSDLPILVAALRVWGNSARSWRLFLPLGVCASEETAWSVEWAGVQLGARRLPQACMSKGSGPPGKPYLKFGGRKFSQGSRGDSLRLLQARKLLQGVGLGSKKGVSHPLSQDTDVREVTFFTCFESPGRLSFFSQIVAVFNFIIFLFS